MPTIPILASSCKHQSCSWLHSISETPVMARISLYSEGSITRQKPCTFLNLAGRKPTVYTSWAPHSIFHSLLISCFRPRNINSSRQIYASAGIKSVPLALQQTATRTQHILDFFTPPPYMQGRNAIMSTVQLIISQLQEPFDLQCEYSSANIQRHDA